MRPTDPEPRDRPRVEADLSEDQGFINKWALLCAYGWNELKEYDEIPEAVRGELLIGWSAQYLTLEVEG